MTRKQRDTPFHKSRPSSINNAEGSWCGLAARYRPACEYRFFPFGDQKTPATKYNSYCCVRFAAFHLSLLPRNRFSSAFISFLLPAIGCSSCLFEMLIPRHLNCESLPDRQRSCILGTDLFESTCSMESSEFVCFSMAVCGEFVHFMVLAPCNE